MGKTNLLDSIHYLSLTKSAVNLSDQQNITHGENFFSIIGQFERKNKPEKLNCSYQQGSKKNIEVNGSKYDKLSNHIGEFPVVLISPNDTDLVRDYSEHRRKFFDVLISQIDREYLDALIRYNHFLKQRNSVLKSIVDRNKLNHDLIKVYDAELVQNGKLIFDKRAYYLTNFVPNIKKAYADLASHESIEIAYKSDFETKNPAAGLANSLRKDIVTQRTNFGVHRDDFEFLMNGKPLKKIGSQGQQKSFVIALRLAEYMMIKETKGFNPILLLDDIFDKLDDVRILNLNLLISSKNFGQIFLTDARPERTQLLTQNLEEELQIFEIENGQLMTKDER